MSEERSDGATKIVAAIRGLRMGRASPVLVAFDGRSGTGKSPLAARLAPRVRGVVVQGDDFYVVPSGGWAGRSAAEKAAGCIDWRRLRAEALEPLLVGRAAEYRPFDFAAGFGLAARIVRVEPAPVILLDGVYSARPELADLVGLAVLVELPDDAARRERLLAREGVAFMSAWHALWDEAEEHYFTYIRPRASFDLVATSD